MNHDKGINWQIIHQLLTAEIKQMAKDGSTQQWYLDELNRMNDIAVAETEKQS